MLVRVGKILSNLSMISSGIVIGFAGIGFGFGITGRGFGIVTRLGFELVGRLLVGIGFV